MTPVGVLAGHGIPKDLRDITSAILIVLIKSGLRAEPSAQIPKISDQQAINVYAWQLASKGLNAKKVAEAFESLDNDFERFPSAFTFATVFLKTHERIRRANETVYIIKDDSVASVRRKDATSRIFDIRQDADDYLADSLEPMDPKMLKHLQDIKMARIAKEKHFA